MLGTDDAVRNELMEQLPAIVRFCHTVAAFNTIETFLPVIVRYLTDACSQVDLHYVRYFIQDEVVQYVPYYNSSYCWH